MSPWKRRTRLTAGSALILAAACAASLCGCRKPDRKWVAYQDPAGRFSVEHPSDWFVKKPKPDSWALFAAENLQEAVLPPEGGRFKEHGTIFTVSRITKEELDQSPVKRTSIKPEGELAPGYTWSLEDVDLGGFKGEALRTASPRGIVLEFLHEGDRWGVGCTSDGPEQKAVDSPTCLRMVDSLRILGGSR